jgi:hypothetical protein
MSDCKHTDIDVYFMHDGTPAHERIAQLIEKKGAAG